jgi:hypothetical protein
MQQDIKIDIIDSRDDSAVCYLVVNDCKAKVMKARLGDMCYILRIVNDVCHINLDTTGCEELK